MSTIPNRLRLISTFGDEVGEEVYKILKKPTADCAEEYMAVQALLRNSFGFPGLARMRMVACNVALTTHGIEGIEDAYPDEPSHGISYCNAGDMYAETIFYDSKKDTFFIQSLEDFEKARTDAKACEQSED